MNKTNLSDLAILGGTPAFDEPLHVGRPNIGDRGRFISRINDMLDRRWLTNDGPYLKEFESRLAEFIGVKHCVAVCNATVGLEIAIRAAELAGEVIVPSFTFIATAHALQWQGITPVFCDIDPKTHNLDPRRVEELITPRTTGIIGVHVWGRACEVDSLSATARRHNLKLLFDAAHALGCSYRGSMIGNFGDAEVFSFHATKFFNTFEGGAILTNNDGLAAKMQRMRNFGFAGEDNVVSIGTNGKMSEVSAAMGLTGLESLDQFISINQRNYKQYESELSAVRGIRFVTYDESEQSNYQYVVLEIDEHILGVSRDQLVQILRAENVLARRYFHPGCHQLEPYRSLYPDVGLRLPHTERLTKRVMTLPTGTAVSHEEICRISDIIEFVAAHGQDVRLALSAAIERSAKMIQESQ